MSLIALIVTLVVIGVLMGLINKYGPGEPFNIPMWWIHAINVLVVICVLVWLAYLFGLLPLRGGPMVPRVQ